VDTKRGTYNQRQLKRKNPYTSHRRKGKEPAHNLYSLRKKKLNLAEQIGHWSEAKVIFQMAILYLVANEAQAPLPVQRLSYSQTGLLWLLVLAYSDWTNT
jgi:hypothetical protein